MKTVAHNSFTKYGARLFNAVPKAIPELSGVTTDSFSFKHQLDRWLNTILDDPPTPPYPNSLTDRRNNREAKLPGHSRGQRSYIDVKNPWRRPTLAELSEGEILQSKQIFPDITNLISSFFPLLHDHEKKKTTNGHLPQ